MCFRVIFAVDVAHSQLICSSVDGMSQAAVDLSEGWGASGVLWPRSIAIGKAYGTDVIRVYIGETLGKIWRVDINSTNDDIHTTR